MLSLHWPQTKIVTIKSCFAIVQGSFFCLSCQISYLFLYFVLMLFAIEIAVIISFVEFNLPNKESHHSNLPIADTALVSNSLQQLWKYLLAHYHTKYTLPFHNRSHSVPQYFA